MRVIFMRAALAALGICAPTAALADAPDEASRARTAIAAEVASLDGATANVRALMRRARRAGRADEIACVDAALSRADVAARYGREHAQRSIAAWRAGDAPSARSEMMRLAWRLEASREALRAAGECAPPSERVAVAPGTTVKVWIDPSLPRDAAAYPTARP